MLALNKMNFDILSKKINLNSNAVDVFLNINMQESKYIELKKIFLRDNEEFISKVKTEFGDAYQEFLYLFIRFAIDCHDDYIKKQISDDIYFDTMKDITIWSNNCFFDTGVWGLKEVYWLSEHVKLNIFKLGRLQFQKQLYDKEKFRKPLVINSVEIEEKTDICFVHIPEGESITNGICCKSYELAKEFFNKDLLFLCDSWLLSPRLKEVLKPDSNILSFASNYEVVDFDEDSISIHKYLRDPNASLSILVKKYESNNKKIGSALGYYRIK
jgi:hypothetical protein